MRRCAFTRSTRVAPRKRSRWDFNFSHAHTLFSFSLLLTPTTADNIMSRDEGSSWFCPGGCGEQLPEGGLSQYCGSQECLCAMDSRQPPSPGHFDDSDSGQEEKKRKKKKKRQAPGGGAEEVSPPDRKRGKPNELCGNSWCQAKLVEKVVATRGDAGAFVAEAWMICPVCNSDCPTMGCGFPVDKFTDQLCAVCETHGDTWFVKRDLGSRLRTHRVLRDKQNELGIELRRSRGA